MNNNKLITILGSTGSIGRQALDVIRREKGLSVTALTADKNWELLFSQAAEFKPKAICITDEAAYKEALKYGAPAGVKLYGGMEGLLEIASLENGDMVLNSVVGSAGLLPTLSAIEAGKDIALANKETLVCAGKLVMELAAEKNVKIIPVDSEHSAIFQCLLGSRKEDVCKIHLTASGGPFRKTPSEQLRFMNSSDALKHPNWSMGKKISVDSATLMNKGLEIIEASWLFNIDMENINVVVHPQSIIHSMVEYKDGSIIAQMGAADMRLPIAYALSFPARLELGFNKVDFFELSRLDFERPREKDFPCLGLAKKAMEIGGTMPACMNAANEAAVARFLKDEIGFSQIPVIIEKAMAAYNHKKDYGVKDALEADAFGRSYAYEVIE